MNKLNRKPRNLDMYKAILTLNTVEEAMAFFDDLCTVTEIQAMEQRYQVAVCLSKGMIYNDILAAKPDHKKRKAALDRRAGEGTLRVQLRAHIAVWPSPRSSWAAAPRWRASSSRGFP